MSVVLICTFAGAGLGFLLTVGPSSPTVGGMLGGLVTMMGVVMGAVVGAIVGCVGAVVYALAPNAPDVADIRSHVTGSDDCPRSGVWIGRFEDRTLTVFVDEGAAFPNPPGGLSRVVWTFVGPDEQSTPSDQS